MHETWYTLISAYGYLNVCNTYDLYLLIMAFWYGKNRLMVNVKHLYLVAIRTGLLYLVSNCIWMTAYEYNQPCRTLTFFFMLHWLWYFSVYIVMLLYSYLHMDKLISAAASMYGFDLDWFYFLLHRLWCTSLIYDNSRSLYGLGPCFTYGQDQLKMDGSVYEFDLHFASLILWYASLILQYFLVPTWVRAMVLGTHLHVDGAGLTS